MYLPLKSATLLLRIVCKLSHHYLFGGNGLGCRSAAVAGAGTTHTPKKQKTLFQASSIKELSENEKLRGQSVLLDESVNGSDPPEECRDDVCAVFRLQATMLK